MIVVQTPNHRYSHITNKLKSITGKSRTTQTDCMPIRATRNTGHGNLISGWTSPRQQKTNSVGRKNLISPGIEPRPADHESNALPLRQTTFGVSDTPDFHIFKTRRESNPDCQRKTSSVRRNQWVKSSVEERQVWDSSPRAAPGTDFSQTPWPLD